MIGALGSSSRVGRSTDSPPTPESKNSSGAPESIARLCGVAALVPQGVGAAIVAEAAAFATTVRMTAELLWAWPLGYLLGSIPFGLLLTPMAGKGDVRDVGSGNIGAT